MTTETGGLLPNGKINFGKMGDAEMLGLLKTQLADLRPDDHGAGADAERQLRAEIAKLEKQAVSEEGNPFVKFAAAEGNPFEKFSRGVRTEGVNPFAKFVGQESAPAAESAPISDTAKSLGAGVVSGTGSIVRGAGEALREGGNLVAKGVNTALGTDLRSVNPLAGVADWIDSKAKAISESRTPAAQQAERDSTPRGDLLEAIKTGDFSRLDLGANPTALGVFQHMGNIFGQMAPVVFGSLLAAGARGAAVVGASLGGAQGGGAAAKEAFDRVAGMTPDELAKVPMYVELAEQVGHEQALQQTAEAASRGAFLMTTPVSALGGAATGAIAKGALGKAATSRAAAVPLSSLEESIQETGEGVATQGGINVATGSDLPLGEGSHANAVLGAVGGTGPGALGAMVRPDVEVQPKPQALVLKTAQGVEIRSADEFERWLAPMAHNERLDATADALARDAGMTLDEFRNTDGYAVVEQAFQSTPISEQGRVIGGRLFPDAPAPAQKAAGAAQQTEATPPATSAPVPAKALVRTAKKRLDELHKKGIEADPQLERIGEDGKPVWKPGHRQYLTDDEKQEYDFLGKNLDNAAALAQRYGVTLAPESPTKEKKDGDTKEASEPAKAAPVAESKARPVDAPAQPVAVAPKPVQTPTPVEAPAKTSAEKKPEAAQPAAAPEKKAEEKPAEKPAPKPVGWREEKGVVTFDGKTYPVHWDGKNWRAGSAKKPGEVIGSSRAEVETAVKGGSVPEGKPPVDTKPLVANPVDTKQLGPKGKEAVAKSKAKAEVRAAIKQDVKEKVKAKAEKKIEKIATEKKHQPARFKPTAAPMKKERAEDPEMAMFVEAVKVMKKIGPTATPTGLLAKNLGVPIGVAKVLVERMKEEGKLPTGEAKPKKAKRKKEEFIEGDITEDEAVELQNELNDELDGDMALAQARAVAPSYKPADPVEGAAEHYDARERLIDRISRYLDRPVADVRKMIDIVRGPDTIQADQAEAVARKFGYSIYWVKNTDPSFRFDGFAPKGTKYVFIDVDSARPVMSVLGHELLHKLRQSNEGIYQEFLAAIREWIDVSGSQRHRADLAKLLDKDGKKMRADKVEEEFFADSVGEAFADPAFWQIMAKKEPGMFRKIIDEVLRVLEAALDFLGAKPGSEFFTDVERAHQIISDTFSRWLREQPQYVETARSNAFAEWASDAPTVWDEDGAPIIWYHGTARRFRVFKGKQANAIFVTRNPDFAAQFAMMSKGWVADKIAEGGNDLQLQIASVEKSLASARSLLKSYKEEKKFNVANRVTVDLDGKIDMLEQDISMMEIDLDDMSSSLLEQKVADATPKERRPQDAVTPEEAAQAAPLLYPLFVRAKNPFNPDNKKHVEGLRAWLDTKFGGKPMKVFRDYQQSLAREMHGVDLFDLDTFNAIPDLMFKVRQGSWSAIESPLVQQYIKMHEHDGFYVYEQGDKNLAVFEPSQIKSVFNEQYDDSDPAFALRAEPPVNIEVSKGDVNFTYGPRSNPVGILTAEIIGGVPTIKSTWLSGRHHGKGMGVRMYQAFINEMAKRGHDEIHSDSNVSYEAQRVYESLEKSGYEVERNPDVDPEIESPGKMVTLNGKPLFVLRMPKDSIADDADFARRITPKQRMMLGQQVNGLFSQAALQYANDPNKVRKFAIHVSDRGLNWLHKWVGHRMSPLGMLPEQGKFLVQRYVAMGAIADANKISKEVYRIFKQATAAEKAAVYHYWTTFGAPSTAIGNPAIEQAARDVKKMIEEIGEKLVKRGLLDNIDFQRNKGQYLPRLYMKHLLKEEDWRAIGAGKSPSDLGYTKKKSNIPEDIRMAILGQIVDPSFVGAMAVGKPLRDIALLDFLDQISQNSDWVWQPSMTQHAGMNVSVKWVGNEIARLKEQMPHLDQTWVARAQQEIAALEQTLAAATIAQAGQRHPDDFVEIPDLPRYGKLRGMLVRKEIHNDLVGSAHIGVDGHGWAEKLFGYGGITTKAVNAWKTSKVALNPPGQIRNFISNMILMHLSGVPMHLVPVRLAQAIKSIRTQDRFWQIGQKYGISIGTFGAQELYRIEQEFLKDQGAGGPFAFMRYAKLIASKAGDVYQLMETVGKLAKVIDEMERRNVDETTAVLEANKWLLDYSLVPPSVRYLRNAPVGAPFVTFYYKLAPLLLEVAAKYPWRFAPYVGLAYILPQLVAGMTGVDDEDLEQMKVALPEWLRDKGHVYALPWKDENGRWQFLDLSYMIPWTMFTSAARQAKDGNVSEALKTSGLITGPLPDMITAIRSNKDAFTGREIANAGDPPALQIGSWMTWLYNLAMPPVITNRGLVGPDLGNPAYNFGGKLHNALAGSTNKYGEPRATVAQALLSAGGVSMYPVNPETSRATEIMRMNMEITEVRRLFIQKMGDRGLSDESRQKLAETYQAEMRRRAEKLRDYAARSEVPDSVK